MGKTMSVMISRAKSDINRIYKNSYTALKHNLKLGRRTLFAAPLALLMAIIAILGLTVNSSYAYAISYEGETIGYVSSEEVYTEAMESITANTDDTAAENLRTVKVEEEIATGEQMLDADRLSKAIVNTVEEVQENYGLFKNGELYAVCYTEKQIETAIENYIAENNEDLTDAKLAGNYEIKKGVYSTDKLINSEMLYTKLCCDKTELSGYRIETRREKIKYTTETGKSSKYVKGEKVTVRNGKNGAKKITEKVYYNGDEVALREEISSEIIKKPVSKKIVKGTGKLSNKAKMSYPFGKSTYNYITSPYGEPRYGYYHKGVDIIANYGAPILATAGGTVVESGYSNGGWGYTVVIDHGNGIRSRYAHCSDLYVAVGEKVNRGDNIAAVGSTGYSECNHLHIEVTENGVRVDPFNYIEQ